MSNDIRKNIMLIESIILDESFKDAERLFTDVNGNQKEVSSYIVLFRELAKRNKIQGIEKDITHWIRSGWDDFKKFVDSKKEVQSKREVRAIQKKDSIQVYQDEEKQVVIPLTKEASIHYGRNTQWCTSATKSQNHFIGYFYTRGITLFYVLFKNGDKYACAFHPDHPNDTEYFDQLDKDITYNEFSKATSISNKDIHGWYSSNKGVIVKARDISNLDEEAQIELVTDDGFAIIRIDNPSEDVQLAAVQNNGMVIEHIIGKGITPSEAVQLAAIKQNAYSIRHIKNPSEQVQLAAVQQSKYAIRHITDKGITPSEEVQLAAIENDSDTIEHIDSPTEEIQLAAVKQNGNAIYYIINKGITPSEEVQLAAVQNHGHAISYIIDEGVVPSEEVQLAAVQKDGYAMYPIIGKGITPSEAVQLAAIQKVNIIQYIIDKGITPSEKVKALHDKLWG